MTILEEAARLTDGDRQKAYRHPRKHFAVTIGILNVLLDEYLRKPLPVSMWPRIMVVDKVARSLGGYKRDHPVDVAGYARTWEMVEEEDAPRTVVVVAGGAVSGYVAMRRRQLTDPQA